MRPCTCGHSWAAHNRLFKNGCDQCDCEVFAAPIAPRDRNAPHDLIFSVVLTTTATPENRALVAERFMKEVKLQFGSTATVIWQNPGEPLPTQPDVEQESAPHAAVPPFTSL